MTMFKSIFKLKGAESTPPTPKIGKTDLPDVDDVYPCQWEEPVDDDSDWASETSSSPTTSRTPWRKCATPQPERVKTIRRSSTPRVDPVAYRREAPTPCEPLKPHRMHSSAPRPESRSSYARPPTAHSSHSRSTTPQQPSPRGAQSQVSPPIAQPKPLKGILKPAPPVQPITLHWALLPYNPSLGKAKLFFDIRRDERCIRDHTADVPTALPDSLLDREVATFPLNEMVIRWSFRPQWDIVVRRSSGLRIRDVLRAIWDEYNQRLTPEELAGMAPQHLDVTQEAFRERCRMDRASQQWEWNQGPRRIDTLGKRTIFMGLRRPVNESLTDRFWELELGLPKPRGASS